MTDILFLPEFPQGSLSHIGRLQSVMTVTAMFTDMAGNIPFLTLQFKLNSHLVSDDRIWTQLICSVSSFVYPAPGQ